MQLRRQWARHELNCVIKKFAAFYKCNSMKCNTCLLSQWDPMWRAVTKATCKSNWWRMPDQELMSCLQDKYGTCKLGSWWIEGLKNVSSSTLNSQHCWVFLQPPTSTGAPWCMCPVSRCCPTKLLSRIQAVEHECHFFLLCSPLIRLSADLQP
jgi:hypothetical protein